MDGRQALNQLCRHPAFSRPDRAVRRSSSSSRPRSREAAGDAVGDCEHQRRACDHAPSPAGGGREVIWPRLVTQRANPREGPSCSRARTQSHEVRVFLPRYEAPAERGLPALPRPPPRDDARWLADVIPCPVAGEACSDLRKNAPCHGTHWLAPACHFAICQAPRLGPLRWLKTWDVPTRSAVRAHTGELAAPQDSASEEEGVDGRARTAPGT